MRHERLLDAAVEVFAEHGAAASIDRIAGAVGINKAIVYQHVASKDELLGAAVERERDRLVAYVTAAQDEPAGGVRGRDRVRAQFHAFVDFAADHPRSVALLALPEAATRLDGSGRDVVVGVLAANLERTLDRLGVGGGPSAAELLAAMLVGMAGSVIRAGGGRRWDAEAVVDVLTDFTLAGFAGLDPTVLARLGGDPEPA